MNLQTKPGKHGTLYYFAIRYSACEGAPPDVSRFWAYCEEHAIEKFLGDGTEGYVPAQIARIPEFGLAAIRKWKDV